MHQLTRLDFLKLSAGIPLLVNPAARPLASSTNKKKSVGIYVSLDKEGFEHTFERIYNLGFKSCELYTDSYKLSTAKSFIDAAKKFQIEVLALFTLGPGPTVWDFYEGQRSIGLASDEFREARENALIELSEFAKAVNVNMIETHVGYIPENPLDPLYGKIVQSLTRIVKHCKKNNQTFLYHAGQETPTTCLRTIMDVGYDNQGIGMDTANLILYDKGHPFHSLDIYGRYVKLVNAKDGMYPTGVRDIGKEVQIGEGRVNFPSFMEKLKEIGYKGNIIIEREATEGETWDKEVVASKKYLEELINRN